MHELNKRATASYRTKSSRLAASGSAHSACARHCRHTGGAVAAAPATSDAAPWRADACSAAFMARAGGGQRAARGKCHVRGDDGDRKSSARACSCCGEMSLCEFSAAGCTFR